MDLQGTLAPFKLSKRQKGARKSRRYQGCKERGRFECKVEDMNRSKADELVTESNKYSFFRKTRASVAQFVTFRFINLCLLKNLAKSKSF